MLYYTVFPIPHVEEVNKIIAKKEQLSLFQYSRPNYFDFFAVSVVFWYFPPYYDG